MIPSSQPVQPTPNTNMNVSAAPANNKRKILINSLLVIVPLILVSVVAILVFMRTSAKNEIPKPAETKSEVQTPSPIPTPEFPKIPVSITNKGFEPKNLKIKKNTNVQLKNNTGSDFTFQTFIQSAIVSSKLAAGAKQDFPLTAVGTYKLANQNDSSQTLEIIVE